MVSYKEQLIKYLNPLLEEIIIDTALLTIIGGVIVLYILKTTGLL